MWIYEGEEVNSIDQAPEGAVGFIYLLTNTKNNRRYIGKKYLYSERKKALTKKEIALLENKRLKKWRIDRKESDWLTYSSSSDDIKNELKEGATFQREILCWTFSKIETYYLEVKEQFQNNVLESDEWYNKNIASKWFKGNLK